MQNLNSVCYVARINEIKPIEGADKIELAVVGGWNCIVPKGLYRPGKLVIAATVDAVIPKKISDSLGITNYLRKGQRVRTVKLKGVYSECLILDMIHAGKICKEGDDLMDVMGIYKYEPPVKMVQLGSGKRIRYQENPNFHVYYKFPNYKNVPDMFTEDDYVEITRKIHGTNARYGIVKKTKLSFWDKIKVALAKKIKPEWVWAGYDFIVGSHNVEKGSDSQGFYDTNVWYDIEKKYKIKEKLWESLKHYTGKDLSNIDDLIGSGVVLYGEIYGPGIQKGYDYGLSEIKFVGFDVSIDGDYLATDAAMIYITGLLELPYVDVLHYGKWNKEIQDSLVFNNFIEDTKVPHEGIVVKDVNGHRHRIAKVINPDYLIYAEKHNVGDSH